MPTECAFKWYTYHIVCYEMRWVLSIFAYMKRTYLLLDVFMQILRSGYIHFTYIVMLLLFATDATAAVAATELGKTQIYSPFVLYKIKW